MRFQLKRDSERDASIPDADLARAARRGDKRAFVEIVARHQAMVCGIALGILGDFAASEDAGQEAFLTAWRKIHELREPESLRAWLAQIARNAALGQLRRTRGHDELNDDVILLDENPTPDQATANREEAALVQAALAKLPETYRSPLVLYYREGKSVRAVAETLGLSEDAVKQRLARGRELMQQRMSGLIESVLTRTTPSAVFTMLIAVAIGALAAPSTVAATAFGTAAAAGSSAGAGSSSFLTFMSTSKAVLVAAAVAAILSVPIGYELAGKPNAKPAAPAAQIETKQTVAAATATNMVNSAWFAEWRELHEKHGTNAQAMPLLYKAIGEIKDSFRRQAFRTALIAEWAEVDPRGGLEFFLGKGPDENQRRQFIEEWMARDAQAAVNALLASDKGIEKMPRDLLTNIARVAPARLAEVASRVPKAESYWDRSLGDSFAILADADLSAAMKAAQSVSGGNRDEALFGVAKVWGKSDLKAAIAWARSLPGDVDRNELVRGALLGCATVDPVSALDSVEEAPAGGRHAYFASTTGARVLQEAAQSDFDATVKWLAAHPGRFGREDLYGLVYPVTERMNAGVADFLSARSADGSLSALAPAIENSLLNAAAGQRAAVWEWLKTQPISDATGSIRKEVLSSAAWQDPELALRLVNDLPRTEAGDAEVKELARCLYNGGDRLHRFEQLMKQAPERLQQPLVEQAFDSLYGGYLDDPARWIDRLSLLPESSRPKATEELARAWAQQTPEEAVTWEASLPSGDGRNRAAGGIASEWGRQDSRGAGEWVLSLPAGTERDQAAAGMVLALANQAPQQAWHWAMSIGDDLQRQEAAARASNAMAQRDPAQARRWIDASPFTAETKADLLNNLGKPMKPTRWQ
jgi:RNA polymerase sigma factor (sigma-70 family)